MSLISLVMSSWSMAHIRLCVQKRLLLLRLILKGEGKGGLAAWHATQHLLNVSIPYWEVRRFGHGSCSHDPDRMNLAGGVAAPSAIENLRKRDSAHVAVLLQHVHVMDVGKRLLAALQEGVADFVNFVAGISTRCALKKLVPDVKHSKSQTPFPGPCADHWPDFI